MCEVAGIQARQPWASWCTVMDAAMANPSALWSSAESVQMWRVFQTW